MQAEEGKNLDISSIEKELTALWKAEEESDSSPVVRACSLNLIVLGGDDPDAAQMLDELSASHPARTFLVSSEEENGPGFIESWVAAKCSIPLPGEKQVCSEQIHLTAGRQSVARIPSVVSSLLVSDIPVVLWHRGRESTLSGLVDELRLMSDFIILDSSRVSDLVQSIRLSGPEEDAKFGDLAWERGTPWRNLLAQVFDPSSERQLIRELTAIRVEFGESGAGAAGAMLFGAWFCTVLGLRSEAVTARNETSEISVALTGPNRPVRLEIAGAGGTSEPIHTLLLQCGDISVRLSVSNEENCFICERRGAGAVTERRIPRRTPSNAELISRLLTVLDSDPSYRRSLDVLRGFLSRNP